MRLTSSTGDLSSLISQIEMIRDKINAFEDNEYDEVNGAICNFLDDVEQAFWALDNETIATEFVGKLPKDKDIHLAVICINDGRPSIHWQWSDNTNFLCGSELSTRRLQLSARRTKAALKRLKRLLNIVRRTLYGVTFAATERDLARAWILEASAFARLYMRCGRTIPCYLGMMAIIG